MTIATLISLILSTCGASFAALTALRHLTTGKMEEIYTKINATKQNLPQEAAKHEIFAKLNRKADNIIKTWEYAQLAIISWFLLISFALTIYVGCLLIENYPTVSTLALSSDSHMLEYIIALWLTVLLNLGCLAFSLVARNRLHSVEDDLRQHFDLVNKIKTSGPVVVAQA